MRTLTRRVLAAMLFGVAVYGAFVLYTGVGSIAKSFERFAWSSFALACALTCSNFLLRFLKWEYYLRLLKIRGIPRGESLLTFLSGFVLNDHPGARSARS